MLLMARQKGKYFYLIGRLASYTLTGAVISAIGQIPGVLPGSAKTVQNTAFAILLVWVLVKGLRIWKVIRGHESSPVKLHSWRQKLIRAISPLNRFLIAMSAEKSRQALFIMGFCSVLIPCGQTLFVFALCALHADISQGLLAGFILALISTPALALNLTLTTKKWMKGNKLAEEVAQVTALILALLITKQ